jgi:hypothetical protein
MAGFPSLAELFDGRHFDREIIVLCVRWYLRFKLSFRDLVEMMAERNLSMAHTTIMRWVHHYAPEFERRWNRFARPTGPSWRVDETGSGANISSDQRMPSAGLILGRRQYRIPDGGRTSIFEAQPTEVELSLVNPAKQFDAGNCDRRGPEPLEAEHWTDA